MFVHKGINGKADGGADFDVIFDADTEESRSCGCRLRVCGTRLSGERWIGGRQTKLILYSLLTFLVRVPLWFLLFYNIFDRFVGLDLIHAF